MAEIPAVIHVIATFLAAPGREDELESALRTLIEPTRREAGCLRYDLLRSFPDVTPVEFVFVEEWASVEELDAHGKMPHLQALGPVVKELLGAAPHVIRHRQVG
jgi:quinol monooxygenase YgiN